MRVTAHISSYASGNVQFCEHFNSMKEAKDYFRRQINDWIDGYGLRDDGTAWPDATMALYPYTPEDNDMMSHNDYPMALFSVGQRRYGEYTIRRESI